MNDEIKEILDFIKDYIDRCSNSKLDCRFEYKDIKLLLDYITNLQQENERLKGAIEVVKNTNKLLIQQKARIQDDLDMLDKRIDKAIEYINKYLYKWYDLNGEEYIEPRQFEKDVDASVLLNILQNGGDDK